MKFSMTEQGKSDLLIQVTAWTGLIVFESPHCSDNFRDHYSYNSSFLLIRLSFMQ